MLARKHVPPLTKIMRPSYLFPWFSAILHQNLLRFLGLVVGFYGFYFMGTEGIAFSKSGAYSMKQNKV